MSFVLISCGGGSEGGGGASGVNTTNDGIEQSTSSVKVQYIDTDMSQHQSQTQWGSISLDSFYYVDGFLDSQFQHNPEG